MTKLLQTLRLVFVMENCLKIHQVTVEYSQQAQPKTIVTEVYSLDMPST